MILFNVQVRGRGPGQKQLHYTANRTYFGYLLSSYFSFFLFGSSLNALHSLTFIAFLAITPLYTTTYGPLFYAF